MTYPHATSTPGKQSPHLTSKNTQLSICGFGFVSYKIYTKHFLTPNLKHVCNIHFVINFNTTVANKLLRVHIQCKEKQGNISTFWQSARKGGHFCSCINRTIHVFSLTEEDKRVNKVVMTFLMSRAAAERPTKHELQLVRSRETNFQGLQLKICIS